MRIYPLLSFISLVKLTGLISYIKISLVIFAGQVSYINSFVPGRINFFSDAHCQDIDEYLKLVLKIMFLHGYISCTCLFTLTLGSLGFKSVEIFQLCITVTDI